MVAGIIQAIMAAIIQAAQDLTTGVDIIVTVEHQTAMAGITEGKP